MPFVEFVNNPITDVLCLFFALIASYYTIQAINERYEFSDDKPRSFKSFKVFRAIISFLGTLIVLLLVARFF